jgi:hypothetical protein
VRLVRQLDRRIGEPTATLAGVGKVIGHLSEPGLDLRKRVATARRAVYGLLYCYSRIRIQS